MIMALKKLTYREETSLMQIGLSILLVLVVHIININAELELCLYLIAYLLAGGEVLINAIKNMLNRDFFDENFLMAFATLGAFCIKQFPEACAVMIFYRLGEFFQDRAVDQSKQAITSLLDLRPDFARLVGQEQKIDPRDVKVGQVISVLPGERIPLDGIVVKGQAYLDTAALTGESKPQAACEGQEVLSGMVVLSSSLNIRVTKAFGQSTVSKLLDLVQNSSQQKAKTENFIRRFSKVYTPIVVGLAILLMIGGPLITKEAFNTWFYRACVFLVISCPCALVISIPLGFFGGIGAASRLGVLVKGGNYLEALTDVKMIVYDKTGTLTEGKFKVSEVLPANLEQEAELIKLAAIAEKDSPHPIAQAIVANFPGNISDFEVEKIEQLVGLGVQAHYQGHVISLGNEKLMSKLGLAFKPVLAPQATVCYLAYDHQYLGAILVADVLKKDAKKSLNELTAAGINKQVMLTGDNHNVANKIATDLGIDVKSELLPQDKVNQLTALKSELKAGEKVAFVGDGLNDTPVLAQADVGIAMGALGSDAAIDAADVILMNDELSSIVKAIKVAKQTKKIVWENIIFSLGVKFIFLILGVFGLTTMWAAVFADVGVTLIAVANTLRLLKK